LQKCAHKIVLGTVETSVDRDGRS